MRRKVVLAVIIFASSGVFAGYSEDDSVRVRGDHAWSLPAPEWDGRGGENRSVPWRGGHAEPSCEPRLHTFGILRKVITECDGAGGTDFVPWFEPEEPEEVGEEDVPTVEVIRVTREDVQSLIVEPGGLTVQPDQPWVLVNTDTVAMTDAAEHVLGTQVLGLEVDVRVTPALYTWDFGDGSPPITGTDPGAPWPDHTVSHVYRTAGDVTISLRTEWDAAFRVEGTTTWFPVAGRAVTVETSDPIEVVTATPRLTAG